MANKLDKNVYPTGHGPDDFKAFGPPATEDGQFDTCKIADLGCFTQDGKDSNKSYMGMVTQSRKNSKWYVYFEWGRTGVSNPTFQFVECSDESDAQRTFAAQLHDKNDKRGQWTTIAGIKTLQAKPNKDCYLVRPMATRSTGLPDAKTIKVNEGAKVTVKPVTTSSKPKANIDSYTLKLMRDLNVATVSYTRGVMADASLPTQKSIDEARTFLIEAQNRLIKTGDNIDKQVADTELNQLTRLIYSRIPKKKALHCAPAEWLLNSNNILAWGQDLDAFESALYATDIEESKSEDVFAGMPITMEWVDPKSSLGKFLYNWWPKATGNRHGYLGSMKIKNIWKVQRHGDDIRLAKAQDSILSQRFSIKERPLYQPLERSDLDDNALMKKYHSTNTSLLLHGTRSVNTTGILREGFRFPKELVGVAITGAAFGPLVYFADDWKKSAGYTSLSGGYYSAGSGGVRGRDAFMFACDVICGNPYVAPAPHGYTKAPDGYHCILGKGGYSRVQNNEWVIPKKEQINIKYLLEFSV